MSAALRNAEPPETPRSSPDSTTPDAQVQAEYRIMRLCPCFDCSGSGKKDGERCKGCRGEGRTLSEAATCGNPEAVGLTLVTLAEEGEFDGCPIGLLKGHTWLIRPWMASPRNVTDAARVMAGQRWQDNR